MYLLNEKTKLVRRRHQQQWKNILEMDQEEKMQ